MKTRQAKPRWMRLYGAKHFPFFTAPFRQAMGRPLRRSLLEMQDELWTSLNPRMANLTKQAVEGLTGVRLV